MTLSSPRSGAWLQLLAGMLALLGNGCEQVLDIQEAEVDPSLSRGGNGTGGSSSGQGGKNPSGGSSGSAGTSNGGATGGNGGSDAGGSAGTESTGGSGGTGPAPTLCERYCDRVIESCDPEDSQATRLPQYADREQCLAVCAQLPEGDEGDVNVNTVECRLRQARLAEYEPLNLCPVAGFAGQDSCGSSCEAYCTVMMQTCTAQTTEGLPGRFYFDTNEECMTACAGVPDMPPFWLDPNLFFGNHLQCRLYHLIVSSLDGIEHCEHAIGSSICTD